MVSGSGKLSDRAARQNGAAGIYHRELRAPKTWDPEDLRELRELAEQGIAPAVIAARLRKTESTIRNKAGMLGISLRSATR